MNVTFHFDNIAQFVSTHLAPQIPQFTIFPLIGPLGAGKTTLIKELIAQFGVTQTITSPTFGYVNSYPSPQGTYFHHFDLYRINSEETFIELGFDEYFNKKQSVCFIEWPDVIEKLLQKPYIKEKTFPITLEYHRDQEQLRTAQLPKLS